ncbi:MAG TPA: M20/M25/M40 family metallo-hydrolase, partial [Solirubrobacteraceae bacterium]|nr:M20/M25/M40 family metallo-hydrolase [Solirubrobacteraceae bacterium]
HVSGDVMGSTVARVDPRPPGGGPLVAVIGHIDEIGLIVTHVDDEGLLWFGQVGGWDPQILVGQRVEIATRDGRIPGVVGKKPIHLLKPDEREKVPKLEDLHIDIGARDGDDARRRVRVGDVAVIAGEPVELANGRFASRSMDNRLGAYVALEAARLVAEAGGAPGSLAAVASAQEETGLWGAVTSTFALEPDVAIVVDVTHATDAPGVNKRTEGDHALGSGPVIGRGTVLHPHVHDLLVEAAEAESIPYTVEATGRGTGTDADVVHISRSGVPTGLVAFPLRYMHSPVETTQLDDVENAARLIASFALRLSASASFVR